MIGGEKLEDLDYFYVILGKIKMIVDLILVVVVVRNNIFGLFFMILLSFKEK